MKHLDFKNEEDEQREDGNKLIYGIEMSLRLSGERHDKFIEEYKSKNNGSIDKFYKVYCLENDFEENKRVEKYWNYINPNVNNMYEFKHLTALKIRGIDAVIDILREEATSDILIETNILEKEQFLTLIKLGKSIYGSNTLGTYLNSITFISHNTEWLLSQMQDFIRWGGSESKSNFNMLCKRVEVRFVEHFDESTKKIIKEI